MKKIITIALTLALALSLAACGGSPAPASPSAPEPASTVGDVLLGTYQSPPSRGETFVISKSGDKMIMEFNVNNTTDDQTVKSGNYKTQPFSYADANKMDRGPLEIKTTTLNGLVCIIYFNHHTEPNGFELI